MIGNFPQSANEAVVSERYLKGCGLSKDVLRKEVSFCAVIYTEKEDEFGISIGEIERTVPVISGLKVCGIILEEYYGLCGHDFGYFSPTLLLHKDSKALSIGTQTMTLRSYDGWVTKETKAVIDELDMHYCGAGSLRYINVTANLQTVVNRLVLYFGSALIFGITLTAFLLVEKLCAASEKNSGIMLISGLTEGKTFAVWLILILFADAISLIAGLALTFGAMSAINRILIHTFGMYFSVAVSTYFAVSAIGISVVAVLSVFALAYVHVKRKGKQIRELLNA